MNVMHRLCFHSMRKMQVCAAASGSEPRLFIPLKTFRSFQKHWWSTEQKPTVVIRCKWLTSSFKKKEITILLQPASRAALSPKHHDWRLCGLCELRNHLPPCQPWLSLSLFLLTGLPSAMSPADLKNHCLLGTPQPLNLLKIQTEN